MLNINVHNHCLYTLVNGCITHQKQQISEKNGDITQHDIALCQCTAE